MSEFKNIAVSVETHALFTQLRKASGVSVARMMDDVAESLRDLQPVAENTGVPVHRLLSEACQLRRTVEENEKVQP